MYIYSLLTFVDCKAGLLFYIHESKNKKKSFPSYYRQKAPNTTTKILLIKSTVSKESHNSMAKITIIHMIFKNKLIIYITPPILSPTQFEYPSFGELEIY